MRFGPVFFIATLAAWFVPSVAMAQLHDDFERLVGPPYTPSLISYAAALGVRENEITGAIFEGRFVPHPADLQAVKMELDTRSCAEMEKDWQGGGFDCDLERQRHGTPGDLEWNQRFGAPPDDLLFPVAQRIGHLNANQRQADWVIGDLEYHEVETRTVVQTAMRRARTYSVPSIIQIEAPGGHRRDFEGRYEESRAAFVAARAGAATPEGVVSGELPSDTAEPVLTQALLSAPIGSPEIEIRNALQARMDEAFRGLDAMGDMCSTYRQNDNPIEAMMCLFSGGGAMNSRSGSIQVLSVDVDHCMAMDHDMYLCRYLANAQMSGTGMMAQIARTFNTTTLFNGYTWSAFQATSAGWKVSRTYDGCTPTDTGYTCSYQQ